MNRNVVDVSMDNDAHVYVFSNNVTLINTIIAFMHMGKMRLSNNYYCELSKTRTVCTLQPLGDTLTRKTTKMRV